MRTLARFLLSGLVAALAVPAVAQTWDNAGQEAVYAPFRSDYVPLDASDYLTDREDITTCPAGQILKSIADATDPPYAGATVWACGSDDSAAGAGVAATWAEAGNTATIPDPKLASDIARDTELPAANRLCPAATSGTAGQVCALRTARSTDWWTSPAVAAG